MDAAHLVVASEGPSTPTVLVLWQAGTATLSPAPKALPGPQEHPVLTRKLPEDSPELSNVSGKGDVRVQDNDLGEVGG